MNCCIIGCNKDTEIKDKAYDIIKSLLMSAREQYGCETFLCEASEVPNRECLRYLKQVGYKSKIIISEVDNLNKEFDGLKILSDEIIVISDLFHLDNEVNKYLNYYKLIDYILDNSDVLICFNDNTEKMKANLDYIRSKNKHILYVINNRKFTKEDLRGENLCQNL